MLTPPLQQQLLDVAIRANAVSAVPGEKPKPHTAHWRNCVRWVFAGISCIQAVGLCFQFKAMLESFHYEVTSESPRWTFPGSSKLTNQWFQRDSAWCVPDVAHQLFSFLPEPITLQGTSWLMKAAVMVLFIRFIEVAIGNLWLKTPFANRSTKRISTVAWGAKLLLVHFAQPVVWCILWYAYGNHMSCAGYLFACLVTVRQGFHACLVMLAAYWHPRSISMDYRVTDWKMQMVYVACPDRYFLLVLAGDKHFSPQLARMMWLSATTVFDWAAALALLLGQAPWPLAVPLLVMTMGAALIDVLSFSYHKLSKANFSTSSPCASYPVNALTFGTMVGVGVGHNLILPMCVSEVPAIEPVELVAQPTSRLCGLWLRKISSSCPSCVSELNCSCAGAENCCCGCADCAAAGAAGGGGGGECRCGHVACFPGHAMVNTSVGPKAMHDLEVGDSVLTADWYGNVVFDEIAFFGHADPFQDGRYVHLHVMTSVGLPYKLELSKLHFILVSLEIGKPCAWDKSVMMHAKDVVPGMHVWVMSQTRELEAATVVQCPLKTSRGLFNPFTKGGTTIIVDGIVASTHSAFILDDKVPVSLLKCLPYIYQIAYTPCILLYCIISGVLGKTCAKYVAGRLEVSNPSPGGEERQRVYGKQRLILFGIWCGVLGVVWLLGFNGVVLHAATLVPETSFQSCSSQQ